MPAPRGLGTINADNDASLGSEGWKVGRLEGAAARPTRMGGQPRRSEG